MINDPEGREAFPFEPPAARSRLPGVDSAYFTQDGRSQIAILIKADNILFSASGPLLLARPSDPTPELQGRLPIRAALDSLSVGDFERSPTQTSAGLTRQHLALPDR